MCDCLVSINSYLCSLFKNFYLKLKRYHRAFIEASNEYLKDYVTNEKNDKLIQNIIDYFTEEWNLKKKSFSFKKKSKHKDLKILFADHSEKDGIIEFKSFRGTSSQVLEYNGKFNKRKLNEFLFVIQKIKNKNLSFEIMKKHLYNQSNIGYNFFDVLQKYAFNDRHNEGRIFTDKMNSLKLILAASYYNHKRILDWLVHDQKMEINVKNCRDESALHLGEKKILTIIF
jgi:hypothetical protein